MRRSSLLESTTRTDPAELASRHQAAGMACDPGQGRRRSEPTYRGGTPMIVQTLDGPDERHPIAVERHPRRCCPYTGDASHFNTCDEGWRSEDAACDDDAPYWTVAELEHHVAQN